MSRCDAPSRRKLGHTFSERRDRDPPDGRRTDSSGDREEERRRDDKGVEMPLLVLVETRFSPALRPDENRSTWGRGRVGAEDIRFWIRGGEANVKD